MFHATLIPTRLLDVGPSVGSIHDLARRVGLNESLATAAQNFLPGPLRILIIILVAFLVTRVVPRACRRLVRSLQLRTPLRRATVRADNRASTVAGVLASVFRAIVWGIAFLTVLGAVGINLAPFVATATVIGAAVGFGAQSLVKDFLSGLLIVIEDQYGVGDSVTIGDTSGTVEGVSLRTTRVRSLDGLVWFIPNGEIRKVGNSSEGYNQAIVDIAVPPGTDLTRAGELAEGEACAIAAESQWRDVILEPPAFWGVQEQTHEAVTIRIVTRTKAGEHARVAREMRTRITERLRRDGVAWDTASSPPSTGSTDGADDPTAGPPGGGGPLDAPPDRSPADGSPPNRSSPNRSSPDRSSPADQSSLPDRSSTDPGPSDRG
jgi:moderate conductance mechanosensitive channel